MNLYSKLGKDITMIEDELEKFGVNIEENAATKPGVLCSRGQA